MGKEFNAADFEELSPTEGKLKLDVMGQVDEMDYTARNFINKAGTVGYSAVNVQGHVDNMFLSKTEGGMVITMPGEESGNVPLEVEGYKVVSVFKPGATIEEAYGIHMEALGEEAFIADEAWLRKEVPDIPHKATKVMSEIFKAAMKTMEGWVEDMGSMMDETIGQMAEAMGGEKVEEETNEIVCGVCGATITEDDKTCPSCIKDQR